MSGKTPEEIAFELVNKLKGQGVWGEKNISEILDMYAECLDAAKGLRSYKGQNRVLASIKEPSEADEPEAFTPEVAPVPQAQAAAEVQAQPVHVQQQTLQQVVDSVYNQS